MKPRPDWRGWVFGLALLGSVLRVAPRWTEHRPGPAPGVAGHGPPTSVFTAFMLSTLARTPGVVPGGPGTFEAASIGLLNRMGVSLEAAVRSPVVERR